MSDDVRYRNTGTARMKTLTITRGDNSNVYDITESFSYGDTEYGTVTDEEFAQMTENAYLTRLEAFVQWVYSLNDGLSADCPDLTTGAYVYDESVCPLSPTPAKYEWRNIGQNSN